MSQYRASVPTEASSMEIDGVPVRELLTRLRDGDEDAMVTLYQELYPMLWRLAMIRTAARDLAAEIVHDVFLALWRRRASIDVESHIHVYLAAAVQNRVRDLHAHENVVRAYDTAVQSAAAQSSQESSAMGQAPLAPDVALESAELYALYQRALTTLSDREREAALLRWEEGLTLEQIGQILGISKMGVHKVLVRAQDKVRRLLVELDPRG